MYRQRVVKTHHVTPFVLSNERLTTNATHTDTTDGMIALFHVSLAEAGLRSAQPRGEASDSVRDDSVPYFVLAAMATVPPRFSVLPAAVQDMFSQQTKPPDRLLVIMALSYQNFPIEAAQVRGTAERLQAAHTKCRCHVLERDYGPISKIVGALHHLRGQAEDLRRRTLLVTVDDDLVYPRWLLENLVLSARHYPITAYAGGTYRGVTQRQLTIYGPYPGETIRRVRGTFPVGRLLECAARRVNYLYGWGGVAYGPGVPESLPAHIRDRTRFYSLCVGQVGLNQSQQFVSWTELLAQTNHGRAPSLLKMDVEGAEWHVLEEIMEAPQELQPHSISFELHTRLYRGSKKAGWAHSKSRADVTQLIMRLATRGFAVVQLNRNPSCKFCAELVLVRVLSPSVDESKRPDLMPPTSTPAPSTSRRPSLSHSAKLRTDTGGATSEDDGIALRMALLKACGQWCARVIELHNHITATPEQHAPRYLEIDCATYSCGGWGNALYAIGQWAMVAYLTDRAAVVRLPSEYSVNTWTASPFFTWTMPPRRRHPYSFGGQPIQTWVLRKGEDREQAARRVQQLGNQDLSKTFVRPLVVVQPDTTLITKTLLRNPYVIDKLRSDGYPSHWLPSTMLPHLLTFLLFQPTPQLLAKLRPYLRRLESMPYLAVHVRMGDAIMNATLHFQSAAFLHRFSYAAIDWACVGRLADKRRFFLASDTNTTIAEAARLFGEQVVVTQGVATHLERDVGFYHADDELASKTFADFYLLAYARGPIVRNSKMTSFSEAAGFWGQIRSAALSGVASAVVPSTIECKMQGSKDTLPNGWHG